MKNLIKAKRDGTLSREYLARLSKDPRQMNLKLNLQEMLPLAMHFLDAASSKNCNMSADGNSTNSASPEMTQILSMLTQVLNAQQEAALASSTEDPNGNGFFASFFSQQNMQSFAMQVATKVMAEVISGLIKP